MYNNATTIMMKLLRATATISRTNFPIFDCAIKPKGQPCSPRVLNYRRAKDDHGPNVTMEIRWRHNTWQISLYWQEKNTNRGFRETWGWQANKRDEISNPPNARQITLPPEYVLVRYPITCVLRISYSSVNRVYISYKRKHGVSFNIIFSASINGSFHQSVINFVRSIISQLNS